MEYGVQFVAIISMYWMPVWFASSLGITLQVLSTKLSNIVYVLPTKVLDMNYCTDCLGATPIFKVTGTGYINLDIPNCVGNESRLIDCSHLPSRRYYCDHAEDVGVRCIANTTEITPEPGGCGRGHYNVDYSIN